MHSLTYSYFFFFNDTATTEIYTLSLHDALPIFGPSEGDHLFNNLWNGIRLGANRACARNAPERAHAALDRKSTRLNSSHGYISYAVFCLKKKKTIVSKTDHDIIIQCSNRLQTNK